MQSQQKYSSTNWLSQLPDKIIISDINLPGTHDSAAITSLRGGWLLKPWSCHNLSITEQLEIGVRLLDIRLKVKKVNNNYVFVTCHGDKLGNEYETFKSVMDECLTFIQSNKDEFIAILLRIDNYNGIPENYAQTKLEQFLNTYVSSIYNVKTSASIPTLGAVRTKIFLLNGITPDDKFGVPMAWPYNTSGASIQKMSFRNFPLYVQDQHEGLPLLSSEGEKVKLFVSALSAAATGTLLLNFASATYMKLTGIYIQGLLLKHFGSTNYSLRANKLGWSFFDYENDKFQYLDSVSGKIGGINIVDLIVDSNFNYQHFPNKFWVKPNGRSEL